VANPRADLAVKMDRSRAIHIAQDFSKYPAGRFVSDGPASGERFRDEVLVPFLNSVSETLTVELDGTLGYGSSFLEEAFGGLVRERGFTATDLKKRLILHSRDSSVEAEIWGYITRATPGKTP
jgi:hypothetical protein